MDNYVMHAFTISTVIALFAVINYRVAKKLAQEGETVGGIVKGHMENMKAQINAAINKIEDPERQGKLDDVCDQFMATRNDYEAFKKSFLASIVAISNNISDLQRDFENLKGKATTEEAGRANQLYLAMQGDMTTCVARLDELTAKLETHGKFFTDIDEKLVQVNMNIDDLWEANGVGPDEEEDDDASEVKEEPSQEEKDHQAMLNYALYGEPGVPPTEYDPKKFLAQNIHRMREQQDKLASEAQEDKPSDQA